MNAPAAAGPITARINGRERRLAAGSTISDLVAELGVDPRPLVIALMIGASACFATPIGYQTNTIVYAAGDYRFVDFVKIGVPLNIITGVSTCLAISFFIT